MKSLTFLAKRFSWTPHSKTIEDADEPPEAGEVADAVVAFLHFEAKDEPPEERARVFKHVLKHLKWLAAKRELTNVVLHSFTHLGGVNADAAFARSLLVELAERLRATGYDVRITPFGWFNAWDLSVHGESLAKVWKET